MNEQIPNIDPQPAPVSQLDVNAVHEDAIVRTFHETGAARALAAMNLIRGAAEDPRTTQSDLDNGVRTANEQARNGDAHGKTRDQDVATSASQAFNREKQVQDAYLGHVDGITDATRARTAAENAMATLNRQARQAVESADKAQAAARVERGNNAA